MINDDNVLLRSWTALRTKLADARDQLGYDQPGSAATTGGQATAQSPRPAKARRSFPGNLLPSRWPPVSTFVSVGLLVILATVVRVWRLTAVGFGGDESVYAGQAGLLANLDGLGRWFVPASRGNSNFLLFQSIVSVVYRVFGVSDYSARLVSAIASILTVLLVYLIARQLYGRRRDALAAGLIMAVSGYAIMLGRLALLDATACFFLTLAMYLLIRWTKSGNISWLAACAVAAALAVQVKVTSALIVPVAIVVIVLAGPWRRLTVWRIVGVLLLGLVTFVPAIVQLVTNTGGLRSYFQASTARTSGVPWHYYFGILWTAEGAVMSAILILGVVVAAVRRRRDDILPIAWFAIFALFVEIYPLKGFNYLLPLIPPLALLAGRAIGWAISLAAAQLDALPSFRQSSRGRLATTVGALAAVTLVVIGSQFVSIKNAVASDRSAGMREAAYWLRAHGAQRAGALALSHGSGQYALSFYGGIDSYPYGRFRIATVIPGGRVVSTTPRPGGGVPLDWVDYWPARLIEQGRVSYLVYQTRPLDDPPEQSQVAGSVTEKQFRSFIASYGGDLVHTVYFKHEARVYIYRVTKRLAKPVVSAVATSSFGGGNNPATNNSPTTAIRGRVTVRARGFVFNSPLTVAYHGMKIATAKADSAGSATLDVKVPPGQAQYHLIVSDPQGDRASLTGLAATRLYFTVRKGIVHVFGVGYSPSDVVHFSYGNTPIGATQSHGDGTVSWSFRLPANTHPRFRITATDALGRAASKTGLQTPSLSFVTNGRVAHVTGENYFADSPITIRYGQRTVGTARTDAEGTFTFTLKLSKGARASYQLVATDSIGRHATITGLVRK